MGKDGKFTKKYAHGPKSVRNVMLYTQLKTTKSAAKIRMARIERNFGQKKNQKWIWSSFWINYQFLGNAEVRGAGGTWGTPRARLDGQTGFLKTHGKGTGRERGDWPGRPVGYMDLTWAPIQVSRKNKTKYKQSFMKLMKHVQMWSDTRDFIIQKIFVTLVWGTIIVLWLCF